MVKAAITLILGFITYNFGISLLATGNTVPYILAVFITCICISSAINGIRKRFYGTPAPYHELMDGRYMLEKDCGKCLYLLFDGKEMRLVKILGNTHFPVKEGEWFTKKGDDIILEK